MYIRTALALSPTKTECRWPCLQHQYNHCNKHAEMHWGFFSYLTIDSGNVLDLHICRWRTFLMYSICCKAIFLENFFFFMGSIINLHNEKNKCKSRRANQLAHPWKILDHSEVKKRMQLTNQGNPVKHVPHKDRTAIYHFVRMEDVSTITDESCFSVVEIFKKKKKKKRVCYILPFLLHFIYIRIAHRWILCLHKKQNLFS